MYPANDASLVNQLGEILGTDLDTVMSLNNLDGEYRSPMHMSSSPSAMASVLPTTAGVRSPSGPVRHLQAETSQGHSECVLQQWRRACLLQAS